MDAFDADVLIYAANPSHRFGRRILALFSDLPGVDPVRIGSVLLVPEVLTKPLRIGDDGETTRLEHLLGRLELIEVGPSIARVAVSLGATYRLHAPDAIHLATAVALGADRFVTNNQRDFPKTIGEIDIVYPEDLPEPP